jgi:hypothetical protein
VIALLVVVGAGSGWGSQGALRLPVRGVGEPVVADEPGHHDLLAGLEGHPGWWRALFFSAWRWIEASTTWLSHASLVLFR